MCVCQFCLQMQVVTCNFGNGQLESFQRTRRLTILDCKCCSIIFENHEFKQGPRDPLVMNLFSMYIHVLKLHNQLMPATKTKGIFVRFFIWWHVLLCSFDMLGPLLQVVGGSFFLGTWLRAHKKLAPGSHLLEKTHMSWNSMFERNTFRAAPLMNLGMMSRVPCGVPASFVTGYIREKHCPLAREEERDLTWKNPTVRTMFLPLQLRLWHVNVHVSEFKQRWCLKTYAGLRCLEMTGNFVTFPIFLWLFPFYATPWN